MSLLKLALASLIMVSFLGTANAADPKTAKKAAAPAMGTKSLYERLGGKDSIKAVVADFVTNCATDDRIKGFFAATAADPNRLAAFQGKLVDQICEAAGGPCKYTGKSMKESHAGMGVGDMHFTALVENLVKSLDKFKVGKTEKDQLLGVLGPMKTDIVEAKPAAKKM